MEAQVVAEVIRVSKAQVEIRCPYCTAKHRHGKVDGWRSSHCSKGDYYIALAPPSAQGGKK